MSRVLATVIVSLCVGQAWCGQQWVRVTSPHFVVSTDAGEKRGREIAQRFELMREIFEKLLSTEKLSSPVPLEILVFKNKSDFGQVVPMRNGKPEQNISGFFQEAGDMNFIALDSSSESGLPVVSHEYCHSVLHANFRNIPRWFDEGFSVYYQTIKMEYGRAHVGSTPAYLDSFFYHRGLLPVAELFSTTSYAENDTKQAVFYGESWLVVHYLFDKDLVGKFAKYMELRSVQQMPVPQAIETAFGMSAKKFDGELAAYLNLGVRQTYYIDKLTGVAEEQIISKPLDQNDAGALIANMQLHSNERHAIAIEEYKKILVSNPNNVDANLGMGAADLQLRQYEEAETYLRKGVAADARNARGQFLYGILQMERDSNEATRQDHLMGAWDHLKTAVRLNPQFAEAHHLLADVLAKMGDKNHAIEEAATAARLNQSNESYFVALGEIYFNFKIYDKAIHVFEQLTSSGNPKVVEHAQKRIEEAKGLASRGAKPLPEQGAAPQEN